MSMPRMLGPRCNIIPTQQPASLGHGRTAQFLNSLELPDAASQLPAFVRPLPAKIAPEDVQYLAIKGALTLPSIALQKALLHCYIEFVYPYMPLIDLRHFLSIVDRRDGVNGQTSLLLYHSIMFSAAAFVDIKYLREAGFSSRKAARKAFFQKTRVSKPPNVDEPALQDRTGQDTPCILTQNAAAL